MKYDDILFIIEAKSSHVNDNAKRGRLRDLKPFISKAIVHSSVQANRVKKQLQGAFLNKIYYTDQGVCVIDPKTISTVYTMSINLHELGGSHTNLDNFSSLTKGIDKDLSVITLTDFMSILRILNSPSERVDYLLQRKKFLQYASTVRVDEMDLLGYYLQNRFDVDYKKFKKHKIQMTNEVVYPIDKYKSEIIFLGSAVKPVMAIEPYWATLIESLEARLGDKSRRISSLLFRVAIDRQREIIRSLEEDSKEMKYYIGRDRYREGALEIAEKNAVVLFVLIRSRNELNSHFKAMKESNTFGLKNIHILYLSAVNKCEYLSYVFLQSKSMQVA